MYELSPPWIVHALDLGELGQPGVPSDLPSKDLRYRATVPLKNLIASTVK